MASQTATAIIAKIVEIAQDHVRDTRTYVATSPTSAPVLEEHIDVLSAPDGATASAGAVHAAVELSKLVDCVQDGSPVFQSLSVGTAFVTDVYQQALRTIEFAQASMTPEQKEELERAESILYEDAPFVRTEAYAQFAELRVEIANQQIDRAENALAMEQADEAEREVIADRIDAIDATLEANRELLEALDTRHGFTEAEKVYESTLLSAFPPKYDRAHDMLGDPAFQLTSPISNETHWPARFFPAHLAEENWIPLKLRRDDINAVDTAVRDRLPEFPQAADDLELNDDAVDVVELDVQILHVDRPWLWSGLFENTQWRFRTGVEPLSDGQEPPSGRLPAFVAGLIFARNLRLSGKKTMVEAGPASRALLRVGNFHFKPITAVHATPRVELRTTVQPLMVSRQPTATAARIQPMAERIQPTAAVTLHHPLRVRVTPSERVVVRGQAVDNSDQPLAGVTVTVRNQRTNLKMTHKSASNGSFVFRLPEEGTYQVTAAKQGFQPFSEQMHLRAQEQLQVKLKSQVVSNVRMINVAQPSVLAALRTTTIVHILKKKLTVRLRKRTEEGQEEALDVPAEVVVINQASKKRHRLTAQPGNDVVFRLVAGKYRVVAHCEVYEPIGQTARTVDLQSTDQLTFTYRPRTILQSEETFLVGFLCYRTPKSPDPDPNATFEV